MKRLSGKHQGRKVNEIARGKLYGLCVWIFNPGFFFRQVSPAFEIWPSPHPSEPEFSELLHGATDCCGDGRMRLPFDRQGFIGQFGEVSLPHATHENCAAEVTIAGIISFKLMPFDNPVLLSE
jgi:hypothetical protein